MKIRVYNNLFLLPVLIAGLVLILAESAMGQSGNYNGFEWEQIGNAIEITGYTGSGGAIELPSTIANLPVTTINNEAFQPYYFPDSGLITSVTIPNSFTSVDGFSGSHLTSVIIGTGVISIDDGAFYNCESLNSVTIPNSVTYIGNISFEYCYGLKNIIIPNSVTTIGYSAFESCEGLKSFTVPASVTSIGVFAFYDCRSVTNFCFEGNEPIITYGSIGYSNLFAGDLSNTVYYVNGTTGWGATFGGFQTAPCTQCGGTLLVTISGHVYCTCDGSPIAGTSVQIGTYSAITDDNGSYILTNVPPATYTATISANNYATLTTNLTVTSAMTMVTNDFYLTNLTLVINPIFDPTITSDPKVLAITNTTKSAIQALEQNIANPLCVKIRFMETNNPDVLAESLTPLTNLPYSQYLADLQNNPNKSAYDTIAISSMPPAPNTGINGNTQVWLTAANLAAIGETNLAAALLSGNGGFNSLITFGMTNMNVSRPDQNPNLYDLQSAATHEIDEVLGIGGNGSTLYLVGAFTGQPSPMFGVGPLDFFRYSSKGKSSFTNNSAVAAYFSIDGGITKLVNFNQYGYMTDFGDWGDGTNPADGEPNTPAQVQDAIGSTNYAMPNLGVNELIALNVIGYNFVNVPSRIRNMTYANNAFTLGWSALPGQSYQVQFKTNLTGNIWNNLGGLVTASSLTAGISDTNASNAERFYRVVASSPPAVPALSSYQSQAKAMVTQYTPITNVLVTHRFLRVRP